MDGRFTYGLNDNYFLKYTQPGHNATRDRSSYSPAVGRLTSPLSASGLGRGSLKSPRANSFGPTSAVGKDELPSPRLNSRQEVQQDMIGVAAGGSDTPPALGDLRGNMVLDNDGVMAAPSPPGSGSRKRKRTPLQGCEDSDQTSRHAVDSHSRRESLAAEDRTITPDNTDAPIVSSSLSNLSHTPSVSSPKGEAEGDGATSGTPQDHESDSDSSLEDLATILGKHPARITSAQPTATVSSEGVGRVTRSSNRQPRPKLWFDDNKRAVAQSAVPAANSKYSLKNLIKQSQNESKAQEEVDRANAALKAFDSYENGSQNSIEFRNNLTLSPKKDREKTIASIVQRIGEDEDEEDDEDRAERLIAAIRRTEGLKNEVTWSFFNSTLSEKVDNPPPLPDTFVKRDAFAVINGTSWTQAPRLWADSLKDPKKRHLGFLSSFNSELVAHVSATPELISWLLQAATTEPNVQLAFSYIDVLKNCNQNGQLQIEQKVVQGLFETVGASHSALDLSKTIEPTVKAPDELPHNYAECASMLLRALENAPASFLNNTTSVYIIVMLLRMSMDHHITSDIDLQLDLKNTLQARIADMPESAVETILAEAGANLILTVRHIILQHRLVNCIPETSARLQRFKRRLALACVLDDASMMNSNLNSSAVLQKVCEKLDSDPKFELEAETDYREISAVAMLLDIGMDGGFAPSISKHVQTVKEIPKATVKAETLSAEQQEAKAAVNEFNADIDRLLASLERVKARIMDQGATVMMRLDAKGDMELLVERIEHAVRTRSRPQKKIFGASKTETRLRGVKEMLQAHKDKMEAKAVQLQIVSESKQMDSERVDIEPDPDKVEPAIESAQASAGKS